MWIDFYKKPHHLKQRISFGKERGGGAKLVPGPEENANSNLPVIQGGPGYVNLS